MSLKEEEGGTTRPNLTHMDSARSINLEPCLRSMYMLPQGGHLAGGRGERTTWRVSYLLVLVEVDLVGVVHVDKTVPPFLVLLQILEETAGEDGLALQRVLMPRTQNHSESNTTTRHVKSEVLDSVQCDNMTQVQTATVLSKIVEGAETLTTSRAVECLHKIGRASWRERV